MAKNSPEGNRRRMAAQRARDRAAGVVSITLKAPEAGKPSLQLAAKLMRAGLEPTAALRRVGGGWDIPETPASRLPWRDEDLVFMLAQAAARKARDAEQARLAAQGARLERVVGWRRWLINRVLR